MALKVISTTNRIYKETYNDPIIIMLVAWGSPQWLWGIQHKTICKKLKIPDFEMLGQIRLF